MNIEQLFLDLVFFGFAAALVSSALMVILSRNPVRSALFLVLAFFASTSLWLLLQVEFLGLVLILVYVGAVMTLFLFVVMTLNIDVEVKKTGFVSYLPYGFIIICILVGLTAYVISPRHLASVQYTFHQNPANYSNVKDLGGVLYTQYAYPFEIAGVILLVAIIAAITLTLRGRQGHKNPPVEQQIAAQPTQRVKLVKMKSENKL